MMHRKAEHARAARGIGIDLILPEDRVNHELELRLREGLSEADARPAPEADELRRARAPFAARGEPSFGIEDVRVLERRGIAMAHVRGVERGRPFRNDVPLELEVLERDPRKEEGAWIQPLDLAQERVGERELHAVGQRLVPGADGLGAQAVLPVDTARELMEDPGCGARGRVVARPEEEEEMA